MEYKFNQFIKSPRVIVGLFAWMFSNNLYKRQENNLVSVSADENPTNYFLSKVQSVDVLPNKTEYALSVVDKNTDLYIYPNPVYNTLYVSGVDEDDTNLIIYDMDGNCIFGEYGNEIEVDFLPKGTYILGINDFFVKFLKL